ncbi:TonB-dependent receptor [Sphingobium aquiterrae]|uniref:TonB-dependent receptor n=1 Tax=Sphingobium aquiterrae TaxID=2038656 RepID=UPI00301B3B90
MSTKNGAIAPAFLALSCVGSFSSAAMAQDAAQAPPRLGGMTVTDTAVDESAVKVEKVESPKYVRPLLDTPQTVTVLSNQTISKQNLLTLRDILSTVPGITFGAGEGGGGYGDSINLRGQSANTDITIDGVRDSAQYSRTDPFNIEQIEVINGANSVYGGSGSVGGTINLVTKRPKADDETLLSAGIGTDNYYRATVDSNVRLSDFVAVRLNAMYHENDVPRRDVDHYKRWGVAPSVKLGVDGPTSLTLMYTHQEDNNTPLYGVPYYKNAVYDGPLPGVPYSGYFGYRNIDRQDQTVDQATAIFEHEFSDLVSVRNLARWQRVEQDLVVDPPQGGTYCLADRTTQTGAACAAGQLANTYYPGGPRGNYRFSENQALYDQVDLTFHIPGGHVLVLGASYLQEDYDLASGNVFRNAGGATPNPTLDPITIGTPGVYTGPVNQIQTSAQTGDLRNIAAYAFTAIKLGAGFELNGGVRYENNRAKFRSDTIATPAAGGAYTVGAMQENEDNLFSYRVGLVYKPVENASLYVAYGNSKNPTSTTVRSGCGLAAANNLNVDPCGLNPEQAVNMEIGGKVDLFDSKLQLTAALFHNKRKNFRVTANDPFVGSLPVNDGRNRVDGITLGASGNITKNWTIFANYTYLKTKVLQSITDYCLANPGQSDVVGGTTYTCALSDPQAGNPMTNTPKHSGSLWTTYTLPFGLQLGYGLSYQGSFWLNNALTATVTDYYKSDSYLTHRAFLSYPFTENLSAQVNVQNFTNKKYYTSIRNNGWANPGEGRSAVLTIGYKF